ncbi:DUF167 family protein [Microvirga antarctica]|uniref:DUF167 family protein n=1 Tax=Microvirga antarctica TaxID=2819233 RepID=UPI001B314BB6|nr:DUF167 family protein [Microvirga antarctica]
MPWRPHPRGVSVRVRVTPRGGRDAVDGIETLSDGQAVLKIRVRAVPEDGKATEAVRRLLAKAIGLPASSVRLEAGATARQKTFVLDGDPEDLISRLAGLRGATS